MNKQPNQSNLFLIRLWVDPEGKTQGEWHGKVQHMNSNQASSFDDWAKLKEVLVSMLLVGEGNSEQGTHDKSGPEENMHAPTYPTIFP